MPRLQAVAIVVSSLLLHGQFSAHITQTALLAGTEAQLIGSLADHGPEHTAADAAVRFFAYSGLLLNIGATLSTILLLIAVASLPIAARQIYISCSHGYPRKIHNGQASHVSELNKRLLEGHGETYLLRAFGIAKGWSFMLRHCMACFMGGVTCTFLHITINLWLSESTVVAAVLMPAVAFSIVPPIVAFSFYMGSPSCRDCKEERKVAYAEV